MHYQLNPEHISVVVSWNHFGFSHPTADIPDASGALVFDKDHPEQSRVDVTLPVSKIDNHVAVLTKEFNGVDYFDTAKYPTATFHSTKVVAKGDNTFDVEGNSVFRWRVPRRKRRCCIPTKAGAFRPVPRRPRTLSNCRSMM